MIHCYLHLVCILLKQEFLQHSSYYLNTLQPTWVLTLNNVKQAAKSGTPAIGVGQGNVSVIVDETANLKDAVEKIKRSKIFDNATSCSSENNLIIDQSVYEDVINSMSQ